MILVSSRFVDPFRYKIFLKYLQAQASKVRADRPVSAGGCQLDARHKAAARQYAWRSAQREYTATPTICLTLYKPIKGAKDSRNAASDASFVNHAPRRARRWRGHNDRGTRRNRLTAIKKSIQGLRSVPEFKGYMPSIVGREAHSHCTPKMNLCAGT
jgi:hypothetical protein